MNSNWVLVFDKNTAGERAKDINLPQIVKNYNPQVSPAPVTIGHTSSYAKDTRVPAGAWTTELREEQNQKLWAKYDYPENLSVTPPPEFKNLAEMPKFLKEAVNSGMYKKRSIGVIEKDGEQHLHHIAYLGGTVPECKGMPDHKFFTDNPEFEKLAVNFNDGDSTILEFEENMPKPKTEEFSFDPSKLDETELGAVGEILDMLREEYGLKDDCTILEIKGAMSAEEATEEEITEALATAGAVALTPGTSMTSFNEKLANMQKKNPTIAAIMQVFAEIGGVKTKIKEFDNANNNSGNNNGNNNNSGNTGNNNGSGELQVATLGKDQKACDDEAAKAKDTLVAAKNWLPSWDEKLLPLMSTLANVKTDQGSALDTLVSALSDISGIAEMQEYSKVIDFAETIHDYKDSKKDKTPFSARKGETVGNLGLRQKVKKYQVENKIDTYSEAFNKMVEVGEIKDNDIE